MRRYFLSYGDVTKQYYLDYGCFNRNRVFLGQIDEKKLVSLLMNKFPLHKEIIVYTQKSLEDPLRKILLDNFKNTRIRFQFEKNLESLC